MLSDSQIRSLKPESKTYRKFDGGGLYIEVTPTGYKCWYMKYSVAKWKDGENKKVSDKLKFGEYPALSLKEAREKRMEIRRILDDGKDPKILMLTDKNEEIRQSITFNEVGREWWEDWRKNKARNTRKNRKRQLRPFRNAFGNRPIVTIDRQTIRETLELLLESGTVENVKRGFGMVRNIFRHAVIMGYCKEDHTLYMEIKFKNIIIKTEHLPAITDKQEFGRFLNKIAESTWTPSVKLCLLIMSYLPLRSTEMRGARWSEIDFINCEWRVPGTRAKDERDGGGMKNRQPQRVPLSTQVIQMFKQLNMYTNDSEYCFANRDGSNCISPQSLNRAIERVGYKDKMCPHGFRSSFSTFCNEQKIKWGYSKDEIEYQLAHSENEQVRKCYDRNDYFDNRVSLMQQWADYVDELRASASSLSGADEQIIGE